ncbi:MAG: molecular chaperone DnaJ [Gemmataceae bacterium]
MSTTKRDYYEVLSVTRTANGDEIKQSYRRLAMQYHPDRNPGDEASANKFKEASEAFEVLADPQKRQMYDQYGHDAFKGGGGGGGGFNTSGDLGDLFGDLINNFFGGGGGGGGRRSRGGPQPGQDVQVILDIELVEAATGVKKTVTIQREEICEECTGTGAKAGTKVVPCKRCGGQGQVVQRQGFFQFQQRCPSCNGKGQIISDPCPPCRGQGRFAGRPKFEVEIPPGVDTGDRIKYSHQGDAGAPGAPRGDLEFVIRIKEHRFFQRDGANLICQWPITFSQAALGGPIEFTTLTGEKVSHDLQRGIQTNEIVRVSGAGMPGRRGGRKGDLLVQVLVDTPQHLTAEQEQLFRKLAEIEKSQAGKPPPKKSVFNKLKDWLKTEEKP